MSTPTIERRQTRRGPARSGRIMHAISWIVLALAAVQAAVAVGIALVPPPVANEGGLDAGAMFLVYFAIPQLFFAWALRTTARFQLALTAVAAISLAALYLVPVFFNLTHGWQATVGQAVAAATAGVDVVVFIAATIGVFTSPVDFRD